MAEIEKLNDMERIFVTEYVKNGNHGTNAAKAAGYKHPASQAVALKKRPRVQKAIEIMQRDIRTTSTVEIADVVTHLAENLFLDPAVFYDEDGELLPIRAMPAAARRHLSEIRRERRTNKNGDVTVTTTIKWNPKSSAADQIMRHLGGYNDRVTVEHVHNIEQILNAGRERVARMRDVTPSKKEIEHEKRKG